jgi:hypothetical protein
MRTRSSQDFSRAVRSPQADLRLFSLRLREGERFRCLTDAGPVDAMNGTGGAGQSVRRVRAGTSSLTRGNEQAERDKAAAYYALLSIKHLKLLARPTG